MDRYETLRTAKARSLEKDLFVQQGMIGWMKAWASYLPPDGERKCSEAASIEDNTSGGIGKNALPTGSHAHVVSILAGIVSGVLRSKWDEYRTEGKGRTPEEGHISLRTAVIGAAGS